VGEVTRILQAIEGGDPSSADRLLPLVYEELRRLAARRLGNERPGQTLQPTALVHEAYLRLVDVEQPQRWNGRGHFFAAAAEAMRRILVENARRKGRVRHGGDVKRRDVEIGDLPSPMSPDDMLALDEALEALRREDPVKAQLVSLRYFGGLTEEDAATILSISRATASRYWRYARAWLHQRVSGSGEAK
jgi:RNA polymerase sigma factor (TIGR02999 family)